MKKEDVELIKKWEKLANEIAEGYPDITDEGALYYEKILELDPNHQTALFHLSNYYYEKDFIDDAIKHIERFLENEPKSEEGNFLLAKILYEENRFEEAEKYYIKSGDFKEILDEIKKNDNE